MADEHDKIWRLTLYVAGDSRQAQIAASNLESIIASHTDADVTLIVVDLMEDPDRATEANILAIPTLIRETPKPEARLIGDLSDHDKVWALLQQ